MTPYYQHSGITIYNGDCREVLPQITGVDVIVADPPYQFSTTSSGTKHAFWADAINAAVWFRDILQKSVATFGMNGGTLWQFMNWKTMVCFQKALSDSDLDISSLLVWDKCWIGPGGPFALRPSYELTALVLTGSARIADRGLPDIWRHPWAAQRPNGHPAEKPISLVTQLIDVSSGKVVLDPFMGSGTTLRAAKDLGREAIGIEIDERWCEVAAKRLQQEVLEFLV